MRKKGGRAGQGRKKAGKGENAHVHGPDVPLFPPSVITQVFFMQCSLAGGVKGRRRKEGRLLVSLTQIFLGPPRNPLN